MSKGALALKLIKPVIAMKIAVVEAESPKGSRCDK